MEELKEENKTLKKNKGVVLQAAMQKKILKVMQKEQEVIKEQNFILT